MAEEKITGNNKRLADMSEEVFSRRDEFAVTPYDGLVMAVHKSGFAQLSIEDSTSFTAIGGRGIGSLKLMTPGPILPQRPSKIVLPKSDDDDEMVTIERGDEFMRHVFVLSGAQHVDKMDEILPEVNKSDQLLLKAFQQCYDTPVPSGAIGLHSTTGAGLLRSHERPNPDGEKDTEELFELFKGVIPKAERQDYVLYIIMSLKLAVDYALSGSHLLDETNATQPPKKAGPVVLKTVFKIPIGNKRLAQPIDEKAFGAMIYTSDNAMLAKNAKEKIYGQHMHVVDSVLKKFNTDMCSFFVPDSSDVRNLPGTRLLISSVISCVLFGYQINYQFAPDDMSSLDLLNDRLRAVRNYYVENKPHQKHVQILDHTSQQKTVLAVGMYRKGAINPNAFLSYREGPSKAKHYYPWNATAQQLREANKETLQVITNEADAEVKDEATIDELFADAQIDLCGLLDVNENIIHADMMVTDNELLSMDANNDSKGIKPSIQKDVTGAKVKTVGLCSLGFKLGMPYVQYLISFFHFDLYLFKMYLYTKISYVKSRQKNVEMGSTSIIHPLKAEGEPDAYMCRACNLLFYDQATEEGCLCFSLAMVASIIKNSTRTTTPLSVKRAYHRMPDPKRLQVGRAGFARFRNNYQIIIDERASSSAGFGGINIKNVIDPLRGSASGSEIAPSSANSKIDGTSEQGAQVDQPVPQETDHADREKKNQFQKDLDESIPLTNIINDAMKAFAPKASFYVGATPDQTPSKTDHVHVDIHRFFKDPTIDLESFQSKENINKGLKTCLAKLMGDRTVLDISGARSIKGEGAGMAKHETNKPTSTSWGNFSDDDDDDDDDDDSDKENYDSDKALSRGQKTPPSKRARLDHPISKKEPSTAEELENDFVVALLHEVLTKEESIESLANVGPIYKNSIDFADPKVIGRLVRKCSLACIGNQNPTEPIDETTATDSIFMLLTESIISKLPAMFVDVHKFVGERLEYSAEKMDREYSRLAQMTDRPKRKMVTHITTDDDDALLNRTQMAIVTAYLRHRDEALKKPSTAVQCTKEEANRLYSTTEGGLKCESISKNIGCVFPSIAVGPLPDSVPELVMTDNSTAASTTVTVELHLPLKMKINLNTTAFDKHSKPRNTSQASTEPNPTDAENPPVVDDNCADNDTAIFNPISLKNKENGAHDGPQAMASPYVSNRTMLTILQDPAVKLRNMNTTNYSNMAARDDTIKYVMEYIRSNYNGTLQTANAVMECLTLAIRKGLRRATTIFGNAMLALSRLTSSKRMVALLKSLKPRALRALLPGGNRKNEVVETLIEKVLTTTVGGIVYAQSLYTLCLCVELYSPGPVVDGSAPWLDGAYAMITSMVLGSLRLIVSDNGCTGTKLRDMEPKRPETTLYTYLYAGRRHDTNNDRTRLWQAKANLSLGWTAFYGRANGTLVVDKLFSGVQGGGSREKHGFLDRLFVLGAKTSHVIVTPQHLVPRYDGVEDIQLLMSPDKIEDLITMCLLDEAVFSSLLKYYKEMAAIDNINLAGKTREELVPTVLYIHDITKDVFENMGVSTLDFCTEVHGVMHGGQYRSVNEGGFSGYTHTGEHDQDTEMADAEEMTEDEIMRFLNE